MMKRRSGAFASTLLLLLLLLLNASQLLSGVDAATLQWLKAEGKVYANHEPVEIVVNKVGPFNNPTETYRYYSLPFCEKHAIQQEEEAAAQEENISIIAARALEGNNSRVGAIKHRPQGLGETIAGDRRETSPFDIRFNDAVKWRLLCKKTLWPEDLKKFKNAIHNNYFFEMFVEDLPMWGYIGDVQDDNNIVIGEMQKSHTYLFPHVHFLLETNDHQIVAAKVTTDMNRKVDITKVDEAMHDVQFTYSVEFRPSELKWRDRLTRYVDSRLFPASFDVHWLSIFNSLAIVLMLTAFLGSILVKMTKNDFYRSVTLNDDDDGDAAAAIDGNESGQNKVIHGDIFRFPENAAIFCAAVGTGNQLLVLTLIELGLALCGVVSTSRRGSILVGVIIIYCLTSIVGGYTAVRLYRQLNGKDWISCALVTACVFPGPVAAVFIWVNTVATAHGSTSALPLTAILTVGALYLFVSFPLTMAGGLLAKNYARADFYASAPTRTNKNPDARVIPPMILVLTGWLAAFLPFSAIYIELHYVFVSMWGHQIYTLWGVLLLTFILLVIIASFFTMALLFFELRQDGFRGWWATFINGGMTGLFIYIYSCYYYFYKSGMSGMLQGSFYFGYMAVISFAFFLMLGSIGFQFSLAVVKYTYSQGGSSSSMKEPLITSN